MPKAWYQRTTNMKLVAYGLSNGQMINDVT